MKIACNMSILQLCKKHNAIWVLLIFLSFFSNKWQLAIKLRSVAKREVQQQEFIKNILCFLWAFEDSKIRPANA